MKRAAWSWVGIVLLAGVGVWGYGFIRRVDGRSPVQWLAFAEQAQRQVAYHAEGESMTDGAQAHFTLDQGADGHYLLTSRDAGGRACTVGYDGSQVWYATGAKREKIAVSPSLSGTPTPACARILGTGTIAGRPVVRLAVRSGGLDKTLAIDREKGAVLQMTTHAGRRVMSEMTVGRVEYRPVAVGCCAAGCCTCARAVDRATLAAKLGGKVVVPGWLPQGFQLTDILEEPCPECGQPMGVLRYSDSISSITLFEMSCQGLMCDMGPGCCQTKDAHALIENVNVGGCAVAAVGSVDAATLHRVLTHLR